MYKCYERYESCETANDCHQMTFLTTRSTARILIINLRHRQALLFTRPAVLLGEGRPDTRERRKSSLNIPWLNKSFLTFKIRHPLSIFPLTESIPQVLACFRTGDKVLDFVCMRSNIINLICQSPRLLSGFRSKTTCGC